MLLRLRESSWLSHAENTRYPRSSRRSSWGMTSLGSSGRVPWYLWGPTGLPGTARLITDRIRPSGRRATSRSSAWRLASVMGWGFIPRTRIFAPGATRTWSSLKYTIQFSGTK